MSDSRAPSPAKSDTSEKGKSSKKRKEAAVPRAPNERRRNFDEEMAFITLEDPVREPTRFSIALGFVPNMRVKGTFYVNEKLKELMLGELEHHVAAGGVGGFMPAVKQIANVASLPGIVGSSIAMPDCHSGYGFAIGNVAAFDMANPEAIVLDRYKKFLIIIFC